MNGGSDRLRQGYGGPPKLHAKAETRLYETRLYCAVPDGGRFAALVIFDQRCA